MDLLVPLDRTARRPLRDQLYDGVRAAILDGRLTAGERLPATRALAGQLGIARFTVADAYARLVAEGYAAGRRGAGTYVVGTADPVVAPRPRSAIRPRGAAVTVAAPPSRAWSTWGHRLEPRHAPDGELPVGHLPFAFRHALPALDAFPDALWNRLRARAARDPFRELRDYGPPAGHPPLRAAIAAYLGRSRGIACRPEQVVVTSGAKQAIDLLARLWLDPGDAVAIEDPGYPAARRVFAAAGAHLCPVPVDVDGLQTDELAERAAGAKLVYVTPSHQFPTGAALGLARRRALLAWARERGALIVEDDYDGEFRYGAHPLPALAGLDAAPGGGVVYVGTFSKVLYPALRLGYAVLPPDMAARFVTAKEVADHHAPAVDQATLAAFIAEGHFERHLARMRRLYAARRAALVAALAADLPTVARFDPAPTGAGLHLLVGFAVPFGEADLIARAAAAGIGLEPAGECYLAAPPLPSVLLGYGSLPEERIRAGVRRLAGALNG